MISNFLVTILRKMKTRRGNSNLNISYLTLDMHVISTSTSNQCLRNYILHSFLKGVLYADINPCDKISLETLILP